MKPGSSASRSTHQTVPFRLKLMLVFMLMVSAVTGLALYFAQQLEQADFKRGLQEDFQNRLELVLAPEDARQALVSDQCSHLVHSVRIRAALEEQDIEDLYANGKIELRDILQDETTPDNSSVPKAIFFRFLRPDGSLIPLPDAGTKREPWEEKLASLKIGQGPQQVGYLPVGKSDGTIEITEIVTTSILDTQGNMLASLVLGFHPITPSGSELSTGFWLENQLYMPSLKPVELQVLAGQISTAIRSTDQPSGNLEVAISEVPTLIFYKILNPRSQFPPVYEICSYSLAGSLAEQEKLRGKILAIGAIVFTVGLVVSQLFSVYLAGYFQALETLSDQLSRYMAPQVYRSISEGRQDARIQSSRKKLTIFFSDIAGFTKQTDGMEPEDLAYILNGYLSRMDQIILEHQGTFDKFMGDAVLVFFGDPETKGVKQDAIACVNMALAMRAALVELCREWEERGIGSGFHVRMGITSGYCTVGNFGSEGHVAYTVIGNQVNLASRLQSTANLGEIVILHETWLLVKDEFDCTVREPITVKGFDRPILTHVVLGPKTAASPKKIEANRDGFSLMLDPAQVSEKAAVIEKLQEAIKTLQS